MEKRLFGKLKVDHKQGHFGICECKCGNIVPLTKEEIVNKQGCAKACLASRGELCAADLFNELDIKYQVQKKFDDFDFRFDFYLPDYNVVIECDGAQHFRTINNDGNSPYKLQETRNRDIKKKEYCNSHGITLLQIPFGDKTKLNVNYLREVLNEINN